MDETLLGCPWKLVTIVSKLGYNLFTGRKQPTFVGAIIHLLSTSRTSRYSTLNMVDGNGKNPRLTIIMSYKLSETKSFLFG